jgi:polysaccharide biosynthesis protein PslH
MSKNVLKFGAGICCSQKDIFKIGKGIRKDNLFVVPNVYDQNGIPSRKNDDGFYKGNVLLFVGTLSYGPNIDGLIWFIDNIFPSFKKEYPDGRFYIVGRFPGDQIDQICKKTSGIELHANVEKLDNYYKQCRVVVVPLLSGGGSRIKILESVAWDRPVLSTRIGAEGLSFRNDYNIHLFETASEFINKYKLLYNIEKYRSTVNLARKHVNQYFTYDAFKHQMDMITMFIDRQNIHNKKKNG